MKKRRGKICVPLKPLYVLALLKRPSLLFLTGKPSAPVIQNKQTKVSGCVVNLKWSLPEDNGCPLTFYTIYYREIQSKTSWHQINITKVTKPEHLLSLKCNIEYTFAVSAWNGLGRSAMSSEWPIKTVQGMIFKFVKEFVCKEQKSIEAFLLELSSVSLDYNYCVYLYRIITSEEEHCSKSIKM